MVESRPASREARSPGRRRRCGIECRLADGLLGAHVRRRAEAHPDHGHPGAVGRRPARAMPKSATSACRPCSRMFSGLMSRWITPWRGRLQRVGHLGGDPDRLVDRQPLLPRQPIPQRFPVHEGHDIEHAAIGLTRVVELEDVRVVQVGRSPDLRQEPLRADHGGEVGLQHLDGDLAMVPDVLRQVRRSPCHLPR